MHTYRTAYSIQCVWEGGERNENGGKSKVKI